MLYLLAFLIAGAAAEQGVVGGTDTTIGDHPWQCSLRYNNGHTCGAVVISSRWVLTAAHCVDGREIP